MNYNATMGDTGRAFFNAIKIQTMKSQNEIETKIRLRTANRMMSFDRQFSQGFNKFIWGANMNKKEIYWFFDGQENELEEYDIYENEALEELNNSDEISPQEVGFMIGYLGG